MNLEKYQQYSRIARGLEKADLVLKNARIVNVFTEEIIRGDIAIQDGIIAGIGSFHGKEERDLAGRYVCPGFIDSHLHLESTLVTPAELVTAASRHGTTTFIVDPHESANVSGLAGIDYILDQTEDVKANVYVMMPSCVPATAIDDNGCTLTAEDMVPYLHNSRILGLGEVMDSISVVQGEKSMHDKLELFEGRIRDGHAPFLEEGDLQAYAMAGIATDHECSFFDYAMRERRNGLTILVREGSAARNLETLVGGLVQRHMNGDGFCFCTDDKHIEDIQREGHIDHNVRKAIRLGMNPVSAIKMATINAANCYGLKDKGAVAPGRQADQNAKIVIKPCAPELKNTVHVAEFSREAFQLESADGIFPVILAEEGQITTRKGTLKAGDGPCKFQSDDDYQKIAVVERHKMTGKIGCGGDNDEDMELAVRELMRTQGGYTIVENHKVFDTLALPVMGLMSDNGFEKDNETLGRMIHKAHEMGVKDGHDPFITLSFMALPVIPQIRITPRGVFDVEAWKFL